VSLCAEALGPTAATRNGHGSSSLELRRLTVVVVRKTRSPHAYSPSQDRRACSISDRARRQAGRVHSQSCYPKALSPKSQLLAGASRCVVGRLVWRFRSRIASRCAPPSAPGSGLGQAFAYLRNHWAALTLFLRQPSSPHSMAATAERSSLRWMAFITIPGISAGSVNVGAVRPVAV